MKRNATLVVVLALVVVAGAFAFKEFYAGTSAPAPVDESELKPVVSKKDSYTGTSAPAPVEETVLKLGGSKVVGGVTVSPLSVVEDSRCPSDVQCIWAGRIVVRTQLNFGQTTAIENITLGVPKEFAGKMVTLVSVSPYPKAGTATTPQDYEFEYKVEDRL